jgi:hypothetical protein
MMWGPVVSITPPRIFSWQGFVNKSELSHPTFKSTLYTIYAMYVLYRTKNKHYRRHYLLFTTVQNSILTAIVYNWKLTVLRIRLRIPLKIYRACGYGSDSGYGSAILLTDIFFKLKLVNNALHYFLGQIMYTTIIKDVFSKKYFV